MNGCQIVAKLTHACERVVEYYFDLAVQSNDGLYFAIVNRNTGCASREFFLLAAAYQSRYRIVRALRTELPPQPIEREPSHVVVLRRGPWLSFRVSAVWRISVWVSLRKYSTRAKTGGQPAAKK